MQAVTLESSSAPKNEVDTWEMHSVVKQLRSWQKMEILKSLEDYISTSVMLHNSKQFCFHRHDHNHY